MHAELEQALRSLNAALSARRLYSASHASAVGAVESALGGLGVALEASPRVEVVEVEGRVVSGEWVMACGGDLCAEGGLFARLKERGFHCLTFVKGVTRAEVEVLLTFLETPGARWSAADAPRVRPGVASGSEGGAGKRPKPGVHQFASVEGLHCSLEQGRTVDPGALGAFAAELCATAALTSSTMIPLAALKSHDEYTFVHTINVAILAAALAEAVGLNASQVHEITCAALLHDVGKRRVPVELINKRGKLTDEERLLMQKHPVDGAIIILQTPGLPAVSPVVAYEHHAHLDGSGYPRMPAGWRPHLSSRIVQVADVYDALGTHRPYRAALSFEQCHEIMARDSGTKYERDLVETFFAMVANRLEKDVPLALAA